MAMGRLGGRSLWGYVWAEGEGDERERSDVVLLREDWKAARSIED